MLRLFAQYLSAQEPRTEVPPKGLLPHSYSRATPYIRVGEAVHLDREDVDLNQALLTPHRTKLNKQRLVPIHSSTRDALLRYQDQRADVEAQLPKLATYLGHSHVADTYWYLTAVPELMQWAVARLDEGAL